MTLPRNLTAVPQGWPARMEIAKAFRTLAEQVEQEQQLQRRGDLAAIRRDCELIAEAIREFRHELRKAGFNPNEPRVPVGNPDGGQWTTGGRRRSSSESNVASDATSENTWKPGAQYAANDLPSSGQNHKPQSDGPPNVPVGRPATSQAVNGFLKTAAYFLVGAMLAGEPAGEFILALEAADWLSQYLPFLFLPRFAKDTGRIARRCAKPATRI